MSSLGSQVGSTLVDAQGRVSPVLHHLPDLLDLTAEEVLGRFLETQRQDFKAVVAALDQPDAPLRKRMIDLREQAGATSSFAQGILFQPGGIGALFEDLHEHVMGHPVWRHPFFVRFFGGAFTAPQLNLFACHYFNQVKNTRQCVALAIGRFQGLSPASCGPAGQAISEMTQVVLAQLLADEYGVATRAVDDYPSLDDVFGSVTHTALYRRMLTALGVAPQAQDVPMLPAVADNVLIQRLVASDPAFSHLEALASVGLGMEWGVPEFFSLLLGGMIRYAQREAPQLTAHDLEILSGHVKYDVLHAVSVMVVTTLHIRSADDVDAVKNAVNMLMSGRYDMMSGLYRTVFNEDCAGVAEAGLAPRYHVSDTRMADCLRQARQAAAPDTVAGQSVWATSASVPLVLRA